MNSDPVVHEELDEGVVRWLLDGDPSMRWQVMCDLTDASADDVAAERSRVASDGWGARLLASQVPEGRWGEAAWNRCAGIRPDGNGGGAGPYGRRSARVAADSRVAHAHGTSLRSRRPLATMTYRELLA